MGMEEENSFSHLFLPRIGHGARETKGVGTGAAASIITAKRYKEDSIDVLQGTEIRHSMGMYTNEV